MRDMPTIMELDGLENGQHQPTTTNMSTSAESGSSTPSSQETLTYTRSNSDNNIDNDDLEYKNKSKRRQRTLSMAYLQDAYPSTFDELQYNKYSNYKSYQHSPTNGNFNLDSHTQRSSSPSSPNKNLAMDSHMHAALRLKHARFSNFSLSFLHEDVESDYREYFWGQMKGRWRGFVGFAGVGMAAYQVASMLGRTGDGVGGKCLCSRSKFTIIILTYIFFLLQPPRCLTGSFLLSLHYYLCLLSDSLLTGFPAPK
jgi:hypothetical protein